MKKIARSYVRAMDKTSMFIGYFAMYLGVGLMAVLVFETISRTVFNRAHIWGMEVAEFIMAAYYLLGGGYSLILGGHVRMDLFYHRWTERGQARADALTYFPYMFFYLVVLIIGGITAIRYALVHHQHSYTIWAPPLAPIKFIMVFGMIIMFLQSFAEFLKDVAIARGEEIK